MSRRVPRQAWRVPVTRALGFPPRQPFAPPSSLRPGAVRPELPRAMPPRRARRLVRPPRRERRSTPPRHPRRWRPWSPRRYPARASPRSASWAPTALPHCRGAALSTRQALSPSPGQPCSLAAAAAIRLPCAIPCRRPLPPAG
eukprot:638038-Pleurochrysis_carterae.AAC.3